MFTEIDKVYRLLPYIIPNDVCDSLVELGESQPFEEATLHETKTKNKRSSKVSWLKQNKKFEESLSKIMLDVNKEMKWNFRVKRFEPLQYAIYDVGDHYDWHVDSHTEPYADKMIRKLSFTIFLNDGYEGGEFDLCIPYPKEGHHQTYTQPGMKGSMVIFPSFIWHKVRPVTKGIRKSLVGWTLGPNYV